MPSRDDTDLDASKSAANSFRAHILNPPDFEIKVAEYAWRVHIAVFAEKSEFFQRLHDTAFKEGQERSVTLHDHRPSVIARYILWTYYGSYKFARNESVSSAPGLTVNDLMNSGRQAPTEEARSQRTEVQTVQWDSSHSSITLIREAEVAQHWEMYVVADQYGCPSLRDYCVKAMFAVTTQESSCIYKILDCAEHAEIEVIDIQHQIAKYFKANCKLFLGDPKFEELIKRDSGLAWSLVKEYGEKMR